MEGGVEGGEEEVESKRPSPPTIIFSPVYSQNRTRSEFAAVYLNSGEPQLSLPLAVPNLADTGPVPVFAAVTSVLRRYGSKSERGIQY